MYVEALSTPLRQPSMSKKLIVAGGGIDGRTAELEPNKVGFGAAVYERASASAETGARMSLWPNETQGLRSR
jgi:heterodisulfide reductase subunit A-like polyferredoxin